MGIFNELGQAIRVQSRRLDHVPMVHRSLYKARKGALQEIQLPCGPLNVRQGSGVSSAQNVKPLTTHEDKSEISKKFLVMGLANTKKVHYLPIKVIQDFNL